MPNWTSNTLTIVSKDMDLLTKIEHEITSVEKDELTGKTIRFIDFNRIVPMPKTIDTDTVGCEADSFRYYCLKSGKGMLKNYSRYFSEREFTYRKDNKMYDLEDYEGDDCFNHRLEEMYKQGADIYTNITKYGYVSWYDWCNANGEPNGMRQNHSLSSIPTRTGCPVLLILHGRHLFLLLRKFRGNTILKSFFFQIMKEGRNQQK